MTSTADISFMLLILFLVTTSMDIDKGLSRQLPPEDNDKEKVITDVNARNILKLELTADNTLLVDGKPMDISRLKNHVIGFVGGRAERYQHVIYVDVSRNAGYDAYFNMQNEIVAAYNVLRDRRARQIYKHGFDECTPEQKNALREYYPQRIAETYPASGKGGDR